MKFFASNEELSEIVSNVQVVSNTEPDTKVLLVNGAEATTKDRLITTVKVLSKTSSLTLRYHTDKPQGYKGDAEAIAVKASDFTGTIGALFKANSDIYTEIRNSTLYAGLPGGLGEVHMNAVSDVPPELVITDKFMEVGLKAADNAKLLRMGLASTASKGDGGIQNGIVTINAETGSINGFSTDSYQFSSSDVAGIVPPKMEKPEDPVDPGEDASPEEKAAYEKAVFVAEKYKEYVAMKTNLSKYCNEVEGQIPEALESNIPNDEIIRLRKFAAGGKRFIYTLDKGHISFQVDNKLLYVFTKARTGRVKPASFVPKLLSFEAMAQSVELDNQAFADIVEVQSKLMALHNETKKLPIKVDLATVEKQDKEGNTTNYITVSSSSGEFLVPYTAKTEPVDGVTDAVALLSVDNLTSALSLMAKGNLIIEVAPKIVFLKNGTLDDPDASSFIGLSQVPAPQTEEEASDEVKTDDGKTDAPAETAEAETANAATVEVAEDAASE